MKYMLMMFGDGATMMQSRSQEWVGQMIEFMGTFNAAREKSDRRDGASRSVRS